MELTVEIKGLEGVEDALAQAGPTLAKRALRKALVAGGEVFRDGAKRRAPVLKQGTPQRRPGELRDAIDMRVNLTAKEEAGTVHVGPRREKGGGSQQPGVYGLFVELGTEKMRAQPYMRPAFDAEGAKAQEAFTAVMRAGVESLKK